MCASVVYLGWVAPSHTAIVVCFGSQTSLLTRISFASACLLFIPSECAGAHTHSLDLAAVIHLVLLYVDRGAANTYAEQCRRQWPCPPLSWIFYGLRVASEDTSNKSNKCSEAVDCVNLLQKTSILPGDGNKFIDCSTQRTRKRKLVENEIGSTRISFRNVDVTFSAENW